MSSKRRIRRHACEGKQQFPSQAMAEQQCREYRQTFGETNVRPYRCSFCHYWHFGHYDTEPQTHKRHI